MHGKCKDHRLFNQSGSLPPVTFTWKTVILSLKTDKELHRCDVKHSFLAFSNILISLQSVCFVLVFLLSSTDDMSKVPSIFYTRLIQFRVAGGVEPIPAVIGKKVAYTMDRLPIHHRAKTETTEEVKSWS